MTDSQALPPFYRIGPDRPVSPVVLSVPHAGRAYSSALLRAARVPLSVLEALEDRLMDRLVWRAVADGAVAIVASAPRAEIDLNRDEREVDPDMVSPSPDPAGLLATVRMRGGLGLVPARIAGAGTLWRARMPADELNRRVAAIHRPYHAAVADALAQARARFGTALLLDCHSMPPRGPGQAGAAPLVFGDRFGTTIRRALLDAAVSAARAQGFASAHNDPYAGGHIVERHGRPADGVDALQIEIDRSVYLDSGLRKPGPGFDAAARLIAALSAAVGGAALSEVAGGEAAGAAPLAIAAE